MNFRISIHRKAYFGLFVNLNGWILRIAFRHPIRSLINEWRGRR